MVKIRLVYIFFFMMFFALIARLFYWQIAMGKDLARQARIQHQSGQKISAPRGNILANDGTWLAAREEAWKAYAWIPEIKDVNGVADALAPFFVEEEGEAALLEEAGRIKALLARNDVSWVPLKSRLQREKKEKIEALNLAGVGFEPEETRTYPEGSAAAHLLGFVGKDDEGENMGYSGLEGFYDLPLSGKPGFLEREKDAAGVPIFPGASLEISAIGGVDLLTHIDKAVQMSLDRKLLEGIEKYEAKGGSAIVMEPKSGAILAISSYPSYEPAKYFDYGNEYFKDVTVSDSFEPGSVFKVLVMAAALDAG
ncbi:hypothetical protein HYT59_01685, partial [Candidatus Woesebacteria bacterium]|nr:hypothetical protein [Candidatus Woesebacteria bacterium]